MFDPADLSEFDRPCVSCGGHAWASHLTPDGRPMPCDVEVFTEDGELTLCGCTNFVPCDAGDFVVEQA